MVKKRKKLKVKGIVIRDESGRKLVEIPKKNLRIKKAKS